MSFHVRMMAKDDIAQVSAIDREAFPTMWPPVNFQHELTNRLAHYIVVCDKSQSAPQSENSVAKNQTQNRSFMGLKWLFGSRARSQVVAPPATAEYVVGFVGMWIMVDEAHIINIAVKQPYRGRGIGELLLISSVEMARKLGARVVTLEVRVSNKVAQNLYNKYGFKEVGIRRGYYTDNKEDALIMTTDYINSTEYRHHFQSLKESLFQRLGEVDYELPV